MRGIEGRRYPQAGVPLNIALRAVALVSVMSTRVLYGKVNSKPLISFNFQRACENFVSCLSYIFGRRTLNIDPF